MAGPTTAERGTRHPSRRGRGGSGPPRGRGRAPRRLTVPGPRVLLLALAVVALLAGGLWVLYGSSWLRVESVRASGTRVLTPEQVTRAADVPLGSPLVSVDTDAIEDRVRTLLPRVGSVEASRSWPRGLTLTVTERTAVMVIAKGTAARPRFVEVDGDGVRFATVAKAPAALPRLELAATRSPSLRRFPEAELVRAAVRVWGELPGEVAENTRGLAVRSYDDMSLRLTRERTVRWGGPEEGAAKARALTAVMKAAPKATHFDVSAPTAPAASGS
ncbi:cell division protein FtsQ/DivIB [Streptomyces sp. NPDC057638]|uniref:cell division protein FtsQ/DivIB n=1 Tax=Streptomyces sp. NPDC057638 TaxID=3346190 RepID=UPI0036B45F42